MKKRLRDFTLDVGFKLGGREVLALMGGNGCGKTTVLNAIAGITQPDSGCIALGGATLFDRSAGIDVPTEKRNIGYLFQNYALFPHMSVYDNVAFGPRVHRSPDTEGIVKRQLESMDLWGLRSVKASKLSGGQKQRVALCRALAIKPSAFLLDEPLSALDAEAQAAMSHDLKPFLKGAGVPSIIVTHSAKEARKMADRVCVMEKGHIIATGTPDAILQKGTCRFIDAILNIE